jgi:hypothetical protein
MLSRVAGCVVVLLALAIAALAPSLGVAQYAPKWQVGDWWVVKRLTRSEVGFGHDWDWHYYRYDVARIEKLGKRDCFVLEIQLQSPSGEPATRTKDALYVQIADWLVVRQEIGHTYADTVCSPYVRNAALGLFGPFRTGEPRLPRFPLQLGNPDTTFKLKRRDDGSAEMREISRLADSALVKRLLDEGDSVGGRVVRPTGPVYQVRNEMGGETIPGPQPGMREIVRSLQYWSDDQPWRLYEELVQYRGEKLVRSVEERSLLVASGHAGR